MNERPPFNLLPLASSLYSKVKRREQSTMSVLSLSTKQVPVQLHLQLPQACKYMTEARELEATRGANILLR